MISAPGPYIVLIDDDEDDVELLTSSLELQGINVKSFNAGDAAINYLKVITGTQKQPSLIILDYNMPRVNGEQVLILLKGDDTIKHIPVAIYTTSLSTITMNALLDLGAHSCFIKPNNYKEFVSQVLVFNEIVFHFKKEKQQLCSPL
jgi:DNA-binding response OmpR family regulator